MLELGLHTKWPLSCKMQILVANYKLLTSHSTKRGQLRAKCTQLHCGWEKRGLSCGMSESYSQDRLSARNTECGFCNICIDGIDGHDGEYYVQMLWCVWPLILLNLL